MTFFCDVRRAPHGGKPALGTKNKGGFFSSDDFARLRLAGLSIRTAFIVIGCESQKNDIFAAQST